MAIDYSAHAGDHPIATHKPALRRGRCTRGRTVHRRRNSVRSSERCTRGRLHYPLYGLFFRTGAPLPRQACTIIPGSPVDQSAGATGGSAPEIVRLALGSFPVLPCAFEIPDTESG